LNSARPKVHVVDSGIAARLLRLTPDKLARRDPSALTERGHLLETFVVGELLKQASWLDGIAGLGHRRTRDGDEVDLVAEGDDDAVVAFEVKASQRVGSKHLGERSYTAEDRIHVVPAWGFVVHGVSHHPADGSACLRRKRPARAGLGPSDHFRRPCSSPHRRLPMSEHVRPRGFAVRAVSQRGA
jgi:hypothetical protein